jgi:hypothetical protein
VTTWDGPGWCVDGRCEYATATARCASGAACDLGACVREPAPPRLVSPSSTTVVPGRPSLRFVLGDGSTDAVIELCRDPDCATVAMRLTGAAAVTPAAPLAAGTYFWRGFGRRVAGAGRLLQGTTPSATWELFVTSRPAVALQGFGRVPDLDGDGYPEVIAGPLITIHWSRNRGTQSIDGGWSFNGVGDGTFISFAINAGDVDGNGLTDLVTLEQHFAQGNYTQTRVPVPPVLLRLAQPAAGGPVTTVQRLDISFLGLPNAVAVDTLFYGDNDGDPSALRPLGDVDGDGYADLGVLAPMRAQSGEITGRSFLLYGSAEGLSTRGAVGPAAWDLATAGDLDGDGFVDVAAVDGNLIDGTTHIHRGSPAGLEATPWLIFEHAGSPRSVGDVDGDGYADLALDRPLRVLWGTDGTRRLEPGATEVRYGGPGALSRVTRIDRPTVTVPQCQNDLDRYSHDFPAVGLPAGAGDLDGDGYFDLAIRVPELRNCGSWPGRVYVHHGGPGGVAIAATRELVHERAGAYEYFGAAVASPGDPQGNGTWDLAVSGLGTRLYDGAGVVDLSEWGFRALLLGAL